MRLYLKALITMVAFLPWVSASVSCDGLSSLSLTDAKITSAESLSAGDFTLPSAGQPIRNLPALCRVIVTLTPSKDSEIKV